MRAEEADLASPEQQASSRQMATSIARGAAVIASITIASRILGLVRTLVFSQAIGATCLGSAYLTAYQVPNLIAELALGGTLTSALVPVLARLAAHADTEPEDKARIGQICSALLTWACIILIPVALIIVAGAGVIASGLTPTNSHSSCVHADVVHVTTGMIQVFAPQVVFYGIAVVLIGLLQAYRRFAGPAVAPILVSLVLITSYLAFSSLNQGRSLSRIPLAAELALSVGATLAIAVLLVVLLVPAWRLHLRFRLTLGLPREVGRRVGSLVSVGIIEFLATGLSTLVVIVLANGLGTTGALVLFNYSFLVFSAIYAVLATSIVTSAFPTLSSHDGEQLDRASAGSTRAVLLMSWLGVAMIAAVAIPAAHVLAKHSDQVSQLVVGFLLFAPGLAAQAVIANLARLMLAVSRFRLAAISLGGSWLVVIIADVVLAELAPAHLVVGALALGNTVGQTLVAIPVMIATRRIRGRAAMEGVRRAWLAGLGAAAVGAAAGVLVAVGLHVNGKLLSAGAAVVATCCAVAAYAVVIYLLDKPDVRTVTLRLRQFARQRG